MTKTATCKGCSAQMIWAKSPRGANLPLDANVKRLRPKRGDERGLVVYDIMTSTEPVEAVVLAMGMVLLDGPALFEDDVVEGYVSHYATCPNAGDFGRNRNA